MQREQMKRLQGKVKRLLLQGRMKKSEIRRYLGTEFSSDKSLQRFLSAMEQAGQIVSEGVTSGKAYTLPPSETEAMGQKNPFLPPDDKPGSSGQDDDRPMVPYDYQRLFEYFPNQSKLLSDDSLVLLHSTMAWRERGDLREGLTTGVTATFLKHFSYNSSRLETDLPSFEMVAGLLGENIKKSDLKRKTIWMNHQAAGAWLFKNLIKEEYAKEQSLAHGGRPICELHMLLMDGLVYGDREGEIRAEPIRINGSSYAPSANASDLQIYLDEIAIKANLIRDVYERSFFLFLHVTYLHVFYCGNRRTARLLSNLPLLQARRLPHIFTGWMKEDYDQTFIKYYETGDWRALERMWLRSYLLGTKVFNVSQDTYSTFNGQKSELSSLRRAAVRDIVKNQIPFSEYERVASTLLAHDSLGSKYTPTLLCAEVVQACEKLARTRLGGGLYELSDEEIRAWLERR